MYKTSVYTLVNGNMQKTVSNLKYFVMDMKASMVCRASFVNVCYIYTLHTNINITHSTNQQGRQIYKGVPTALFLAP